MSNLLLVDDDPNFKAAFQIEAQTQGLSLIYRKSFEGLMEIMPKHHMSITAIVLDIKCLIKDDQVKEDSDFIGTATRYLDENFPGFPRLILTGDDDAFDGYIKFTTGEDIYKKTPDGIANALLKIGYYVANSEKIQIKRSYSDVFSIFDSGKYDANTEATLINILKRKEEKEFAKLGGIFRDIRAMQESIYKTININNKPVVPDNKIKPNGMIDFNKLKKHLSGYPDASFRPTTAVYQNSAIENLSDSLYWVCGKYIHSAPNEVYFVSNYTLKSLIYNLLELFLWSKQYI